MNGTPRLSIHSPGGTGRSVSPGLTPPPATPSPQPSPLSPSQGYCPVVRGLAPAATNGGGLVALVPNSTVRSASSNRLGSLFNSINKSVTSAFSSFVAVNQPIPGVIKQYDHSPHPSMLQRQQSQTKFPAPPRRSSAQQDITAAMLITSSPQVLSSAAGNSVQPMVSVKCIALYSA